MTHRELLERALLQVQPTHPDLDEVSRNIIFGFVEVLQAATHVRDAQKMYFLTRSGNDLDKALKAERVLDKLLKFWVAEMKDVPHSGQVPLFD